MMDKDQLFEESKADNITPVAESPKAVVREEYYNSGCATKIATSPMFESLTLLVVSVNAVWIGVDLDLNKQPSLLTARTEFVIMDNFFVVYFLFELVVRFAAVKVKMNLLRDPWFLFDAFLLAFMIVETWIITIIVAATGQTGENPMRNFSLLRMLRLLRLTRLVKLVRALPELMTLLKAFASASRSCVVTMLLLIVLIYVYAIALTQYTEGSELGQTIFMGVLRSMYTLAIDGMLPDYSPLVQLVEPAGWLPTTVVISFVCIATFTILNMLVGILCDVAIRVSKTSRDKVQYDYVVKSLQDIIRTDIDVNDDGEISKDEFLGIMANEQAAKVVRSIGVDISSLAEQADLIYDAVDEHGEDYERKLTFSEFMETLVSMQPGSEVTLKDVNALRKFVDRRISSIESRVTSRKKSRASVSEFLQAKQGAAEGAAETGAQQSTEQSAADESGNMIKSWSTAGKDLTEPFDIDAVALESALDQPATKGEVDQLRQQLLGLREVAEKLVESQVELSSNVQELHGQLTSMSDQFEATDDQATQKSTQANNGFQDYSQGARSAKPLPNHPGDGSEPHNSSRRPSEMTSSTSNKL